MQVPQAQLLSLRNIARLWAGELRGTSLEGHSDGPLNRMRLAFATGELRAVDSAATKSLREAAYEQLLAANGLADFDREDGLGLSEQITEVKLSRAEFQRWVQEQGVLRRDGSATGRLEGREFQILGVSSDQGQCVNLKWR